ncbi:mitochondrial dicarboxylate carrier isoform X2 [Anabrus simplex]|uniref:mitochondrial dicarboxylate carrier isoform X2 n=1 Tax=Anabrus simplex TaxID=316456 RepID=UPI0034DCCFE8
MLVQIGKILGMEEKRLARWWMGGVASAGACCFTQWLDTIKVHQQTQQEVKDSMYRLTVNIVKQEGLMGLNYGLSAAILRQLTYSTFRFAFYEYVKQRVTPLGEGVPFYQKVGIGAIGGAIGGYIGTPADMINVRMQNDTKLPPDKRRNYKHAFDGIARIYKEEGARGLFAGATAATTRSVFMTVGQLCFYDQIKSYLLEWKFKDAFGTHFLASLLAGAVATTLTQPIDVIKTRVMNAKPGEYKNTWDLIKYTAKLGPQGFFKEFPVHQSFGH